MLALRPEFHIYYLIAAIQRIYKIVRFMFACLTYLIFSPYSLKKILKIKFFFILLKKVYRIFFFKVNYQVVINSQGQLRHHFFFFP